MKLFRKRYIPDEIIDISSDEVLYRDEKLIITKWLPINKRNDIGSGMSFTFLEEGYKISKLFDLEGNFLYWYCDIIDYKYDEAEDTYTIIDLLVDLKVYKDGSYHVLDMNELVEAYDKKMINFEDVLGALRKLCNLVELVRAGKFPPEECKNDRY